METKQVFEKVMKESTQIALASLSTMVGEAIKPNVRLMCFYYDFGTKKVYFCTFNKSPKVLEFENDKHVSFTTCPIDGDLAARVEEAVIEKSSKSVMEILDEISKKIDMFNEIKSGDISNIVPYEISFETLNLHVGHNSVVSVENR